MQEKVTYTINVHHEDGFYWADVVEVPGCFATGDTQEELMEGLSEALGFALSTPSSAVHAALHSLGDPPSIRTVQAQAQLSSCAS